MSQVDPLKAYRQKRDFKITSEPAQDDDLQSAGNRFVIQKHWARRLHYDFRLELDGSMKSWAVPKGPSLDPKDKRMAVEVEDHPVSYARFEGQIPAGQYGAGKVIVWDCGTWHPIGDARQGYRSGNLKFELQGHKLSGRWALIRMKGKGEKQTAWLLIKERDSAVRRASEYSVVDELPESVLAQLPLGKPKPSTPERAVKTSKAALPASQSPQLATLVTRPPTDVANWIFEIKFDGYRMLVRIDGSKPRFFTRNGVDWTNRLGPLVREIAKAKLPSGWYDGEIVVQDEHGLPDFGALQQVIDTESASAIVLYLFDVMFVDGKDLRASPLSERRALLEQLLDQRVSEHLRFSQQFVAAANDLMSSACKLGLEGIIGKRRDSPYSAMRSSDWIKLKCSQRQEFVIAGYTDPKGGRTGLGALLLGVHDQTGALRYAGKVGTGFDDIKLATIHRQLLSLHTTRSPFAKGDRIPGKPHWVLPKLVAEVRFANWTRGGHIRHASFHALRSDKSAKQVLREHPKPPSTSAEGSQTKGDDALARSIGLKVTHPKRIIDPSTGINKLELVSYYELVGKLMMEHLDKRPVSLVRAPDSVGGALFFQKHAETERLPGVVALDRSLEPEHAPMLAIEAPKGLLSAAQWGVVEFHSRNAVTSAFETPDRIVFDLDPGEGVHWHSVIEAAEIMHGFLRTLKLNSFLKTSGGKGLHIVLPIRPLYDWDTVKAFSKAIVLHLARVIPDRFVAVSGPRNRVGKIFIDYLRNGRAATTAVAWSARARPGMGISVPISWSELPMLRSADQWTVRNVQTRLAVGNAAWSGYRKSARDISAAMKRISASSD